MQISPADDIVLPTGFWLLPGFGVHIYMYLLTAVKQCEIFSHGKDNSETMYTHSRGTTVTAAVPGFHAGFM